MRTACFAIEPIRGRAEDRGRPRSIGMALAILHAPSEDAELDERKEKDDQGEDERERGTEAELRLLERGLEDEERDRARRVERAAEPVGENVDRVERPQHTDRSDSEDEEGGRREKRQCDLREDLALARAVEARRFVVLLRDVREPRQTDHDLVAEVMPDGDERDHDEREAWAGEPCRQRYPEGCCRQLEDAARLIEPALRAYPEDPDDVVDEP